MYPPLRFPVPGGSARPPLVLRGAIFAALLSVPAWAQTSPAPAPNDVVSLSEFTVNSSQDKGYGSTNSLGASRINIAIQNIPASVIVVNRELINDVGATEFVDALRFVSGVSNTSSPLNGQLTVRGAGLSSTLRDGLPEGFNIASGGFDDFAPYDRIEVIKGPAGSLYGSHSIGGLINRVSKQPLGTPLYSISGELSTTNGHQIYRAEADATGPIDAKGKWRYRVVGADSDGKTWYDRNYRREVFNPYVTFNPTSDIKFWARYEYQYSDIANVASPWFANKAGQISNFLPRDNVSDDPWESFKLWKHYIEGGAEARLFDGHWTSRLTGRFDQENRHHVRYIKSAAGSIKFYDKLGNLLGTDQSANISFNDPSVFGSITHSRQLAPENQNQWSRSLYWDNVVNLDTGPISQKMLIYGAVNSVDGDNLRNVSALATTPVFDYLHPIYNPVFNSLNLPLTTTVNTSFTGSTYNFGIQDNISVFRGRLILVGGARHDKSINDSLNKLNNTATQNVGSANSYKAGVVGKVIEGLSLFYNYSQTFNPQFGTYFRFPDLVSLPRQNQRGVTNEGGVKVDLLENRIIATASYFKTTQDNTLGTGATINGTPTSILLGDQLIKGWEADVAAQPISSVTLMVGLSNVNSRSATGIPSIGVSQGLTYKGLAKYTFGPGIAKGLAVGAGYEHENNRPGDANNAFTLPAFGIWNAFITYRLSHWTFQTNVDNLADKVYAGSAPQALLVYPGQPRTWKFQVGYKF